MNKHPYRGQFVGCGPKLIEKLDFLNIKNIDELKAIGSEGAIKSYIDKNGGRKPGMCSCLAYQFEGLITDCERNKILPYRKQELITFVKKYRKVITKESDGSITDTGDTALSNSYSPSFTTIADEIDILMKDFSHTRKDLGYGQRRTFDNKMRFDMYTSKGKNILRVGRGAWLVRQHPVLYDRFDEVAKVIAKIEIDHVDMLYDRHITGIFELLNQAPSGIGAFD